MKPNTHVGFCPNNNAPNFPILIYTFHIWLIIVNHQQNDCKPADSGDRIIEMSQLRDH